MLFSGGGVCSHSSHTHAPTTSSTLFFFFSVPPPQCGDCRHVLQGAASSGTPRNIKPGCKVILTSK